MYLFDTNLISEIRRLNFGKCNLGVKNWIQTIPPEQIYTNAIVMMELERGVLGKERKDPEQGKVLRNWFENFVKPTFEEKILDIDTATASICARLYVPDKSPENDAWIAATALRYNLTLVTRNTKDFEHMGVKLFNPFI